jgi:Tfp pilus assembly protein PilF
VLEQYAVETDPQCAHAWQAWACMERRAGDIARARTLFQKGVNADPTHIPVWQAWADMEADVGEWGQGPACTLPEL